MKIEMTEEAIVFCDGLTCDPIAMWESCAACGNCPLLRLCEEYFQDKMDGAY